MTTTSHGYPTALFDALVALRPSEQAKLMEAFARHAFDTGRALDKPTETTNGDDRAGQYSFVGMFARLLGNSLADVSDEPRPRRKARERAAA